MISGTLRVPSQAARSIGWWMGFVVSVCQPSTLRMLICPEASSAQNNIAAVSADGSTVWVLIRRLNSSWRRSIAFVVLALRHWVGGRRVKAKRRSPASFASFLQAIRDGAMRQPPLADEGLAARCDLLGRGRVDHVGVIGGLKVIADKVRTHLSLLFRFRWRRSVYA